MEKLEVDLLVLCDQAIISKDNKLSIIGIFDQIFTEKVPSTHPKMAVVGVLQGPAGSKHQVNLIIENPLGEIPFNTTLDVSLGPNGKANILAELANFPSPVAGIYKVKVIVEKSELKILEFNVLQISGQSNTPDISKQRVLN